MRKNNAVNSYVSGIKKLRARENPFADDVSGDSETDSKREITHKTAYVRPKLGTFAAAAVLLVFVSVGAVFLGQRIKNDRPAAERPKSFASSDDTASEERSADNKYTSIKDALEAYREADRQVQEVLYDFDRRLETEQDIDNLIDETHARLMMLSHTCDTVVEFLKSVDAGVLLLDVYRHEGDEALYLAVFNGLPQQIELYETAEVYNNITGEEYTNATLDSSVVIESDIICEIRLLPEKPLSGELNLRFYTEDRSPVIFDYDFSEAVTTLSRERIEELTKILYKE